MKIELDRNDLINMVCGTSPDIHKCIEYENLGWMVLTGNQHNPQWMWNRKTFDDPTFTEDALYWLYNLHKNKG